ncbi:hypothetical protein AMST5_03878 [freshwater sediment metagenome]|uniref:Glycosyltransferase 2-like domain-containing protein n=1 Tax=freshwater sediment metagenome TaxID=556182 RepID=A0AA48RAR5_9ZZZZ
MLSIFDTTEAVSRMKIQPIKEYMADAYEFSEFAECGEAPAAVLVVAPLSLATSGRKFHRLLNCARSSLIILFIPDFLVSHAKKLEYWSSFVDVFVVPTPEMQKLIKAYTEKAVWVLFDPIDFQLKTSCLRRHEGGSKLVVGWFGYPESYKKSMKEYSGVLEEMHFRNEIEYRIITNPQGFERDKTHIAPGFNLIEYNVKTFLNHLCSMDICVVSHTPFDFSVSTYWKSENKAVLAINRGVPTIASATPAYERLLNNCGLSQYLFHSKEEIRTAVKALSDPAARNTYLAASQEFVLENFNCDKMVADWCSMFDEARQLKAKAGLGRLPGEITATPVAETDFAAKRKIPPNDADAQNVDLSVVVCTRNRADQLACALRHWGKLAPKSRWELIVVDSGSTDETHQVLAEAQKPMASLRCASTPHIGRGAARDRGWREARGAIVAFTDDDCYPSSGYVDDYVEAFRHRPDVGYIGGRILLWHEDEVRLAVDDREAAEELAPYRFVPTEALHGTNVAVRRDALEKIGGVDPELSVGTRFAFEVIDLVAALAWAGYPGKFDPSPLVYHHDGRKVGDMDKTVHGYYKGRGAYFAKYILRKDSRAAYFWGWARSVMKCVKQAIVQRNKSKLITPAFELYGACSYLFRRRTSNRLASCSEKRRRHSA